MADYEEPSEEQMRELFRAHVSRPIRDLELPDPDDVFLKPEYLDGNPGAGIRIDRLENSVRALLRKNSQRASLRMIHDSPEQESGEIRRLTPVRKAMSFSNEELNFLIAVMNSIVVSELNYGRNAVERAESLGREFTALRRNWQDEARNNGEIL